MGHFRARVWCPALWVTAVGHLRVTLILTHFVGHCCILDSAAAVGLCTPHGAPMVLWSATLVLWSAPFCTPVSSCQPSALTCTFRLSLVHCRLSLVHLIIENVPANIFVFHLYIFQSPTDPVHRGEICREALLNRMPPPSASGGREPRRLIGATNWREP